MEPPATGLQYQLDMSTIVPVRASYTNEDDLHIGSPHAEGCVSHPMYTSLIPVRLVVPSALPQDELPATLHQRFAGVKQKTYAGPAEAMATVPGIGNGDYGSLSALLHWPTSWLESRASTQIK